MMYKTTLEEIAGFNNRNEFCTIPVGAMVRNVISWQNKSIFDYSTNGGFNWTTVKTLEQPIMSEKWSPKIKQSHFFDTLS